MSSLRYFSVPLLFGGVLLWTGALASPFASSTSSTQPPPAPAAADVEPLLDQALVRLTPDRLSWLEMTLWQQVDLPDLHYQAEGRYLAGPDYRLRLELKVRAGGTASWLHVVSDGRTLWQCRQVGAAGPRKIVQTDLQAVCEALNELGSAAPLRDEVLQEHYLGGLRPLLARLRQHVTWNKRETVRRHGRRFLKLTGTWNVGEGAVPALPFTEEFTRQIRLYLDPETLWPHRLEWWGPGSAPSPDVLLMQLEFRDPVLNVPLPAERAATEFRMDLGREEVLDRTDEVVSRLKGRSGL